MALYGKTKVKAEAVLKLTAELLDEFGRPRRPRLGNRPARAEGFKRDLPAFFDTACKFAQAKPAAKEAAKWAILTEVFGPTPWQWPYNLKDVDNMLSDTRELVRITQRAAKAVAA